MNHIAKSRVGLAADGKTLVDADSEESVTLFAAENGSRSDKDIAGKVNVSKYFTSKDLKESTPEASVAKRVVEGEATAERAKPAKVVKAKADKK